MKYLYLTVNKNVETFLYMDRRGKSVARPVDVFRVLEHFHDLHLFFDL
jgi:hypothetical protein